MAVENAPGDCVLIVNASQEGSDVPLGGIQKAIIGQIAALRSRGIAVYFLSASYRSAQIARDLGCTVYYDTRWHNSIKPLIIPDLARILVDLRRKRPAAVIHHSGRTWTWGYVFFFGIPNIAVIHRELIRPYRFFRRWLALTPGHTRKLEEIDPFRFWRRVAWAPNCLMHDLAPTAPPPRAEPPLSEESSVFTLGFLGRAGEGKGLDTLLKAMQTVRAQGTDVRLTLAGAVDPWVEEAATELGLRDALQALGWLEDTTAFFEEIDCLVVPSKSEAFGLVIIEAMTAGLAVIASRCTGPESIIVDDETGILVPIDDDVDLARAILELSSDVSRARKMGELGRRRVLERYTPKSVAGQLIDSLGRLGARFRNT